MTRRTLDHPSPPRPPPRSAPRRAGFGVALARVTLAAQLPYGLRQLAGVLLKQYVNTHWDPSDEASRQLGLDGSYFVQVDLPPERPFSLCGPCFLLRQPSPVPVCIPHDRFPRGL